MAQRTAITLTHDIDGSEAVDTVAFALDGAAYEIDLNKAHAQDLREVLAPYVAAGRGPGSPAEGRARRASAPRRRSSEEVNPKAVRAWAQAAGVEVNARGRLRAEVVEQYRAANT